MKPEQLHKIMVIAAAAGLGALSGVAVGALAGALVGRLHGCPQERKR